MHGSRGHVGALVGVLLAGCLSPSLVGERFDPIPAPVWEPGFEWTYQVVTASHQSSFDGGGLPGDDGDASNVTATLRVTNVSADVLGEPSYFVSVDPSLDHPLFNGELEAFSRSTLAPIGVGFRGSNGDADGSLGPCRSDASLTPLPVDARFPFLQFPLDDGGSTSGQWGFDAPLQLQYILRTHGMVDVDVPAGHFRAVYVTVDLQPLTLPQAGGYDGFQLRAHGEQWYSPDVRFLVKSTLSASVQNKGQGAPAFQYQYQSSLLLSSYQLSRGPDQPAPDVATGEDRVPPAGAGTYRIVSDTDFPANVANGGVHATFGLESSETSHPRGSVPQRSSIPASLPIDHSGLEVVWLVDSQGRDGVEHQLFRGDTLAYNFTRGALYSLRAEVRPLVCGGGGYSATYADVATYWSKTFNVSIDAGLPRTIDLGRFPVEMSAWSGEVKVTRSAAFAAPVDKGHVALKGPDGRTQTTPSGAAIARFGAFPEGDWSLLWDTEQPTVGDDASVTVTITYSPDAPS